MKNLNFYFSRGAVILALFAVLGFTACSDDDNDDVVPSQKTIAEIVVGNNDFSLLESALVHAGLSGVLDEEGTYTVFAPNNAAFAAAGLDSEAKIKALPVSTLKNILLYHVLGQKVPASAIANASNTSVETLAKSNIFVTKNANGVFVNGAAVTQADVMASNGVIHVINTVLMPAMGNIVEVAQGNPNFSFLVAAVLRASQGSTNVAQVLTGAGPYTVFAPTNQAFMDAGFATITAIQNANPADLTAILTYHVIAGRIFSSDLTEGAKPETLNGGTLSISLNGGAKVKGNGNTTAATISQANLMSSNGVIHVVDKVLLP